MFKTRYYFVTESVVIEFVTREVKKQLRGRLKSTIFADYLMIWGEDTIEKTE